MKKPFAKQMVCQQDLHLIFVKLRVTFLGTQMTLNVKTVCFKKDVLI